MQQKVIESNNHRLFFHLPATGTNNALDFEHRVQLDRSPSLWDLSP